MRAVSFIIKLFSVEIDVNVSFPLHDWVTKRAIFLFENIFMSITFDRGPYAWKVTFMHVILARNHKFDAYSDDWCEKYVFTEVLKKNVASLFLLPVITKTLSLDSVALAFVNQKLLMELLKLLGWCCRAVWKGQQDINHLRVLPAEILCCWPHLPNFSQLFSKFDQLQSSFCSNKLLSSLTNSFN